MAAIYRNGNGRWTAQVNLSGKRRSKTFATKSEAQRWARIEEANRATSGTVAASGVFRFSDVLVAYAEAAGDVSRSRAAAIAHINDLLGRKRLADLDADAFRTFAMERANEGAGPATIGQDLTYIHTILNTGGPLVDAPVAAPLRALAAARNVLRMSGQVSRPAQRERRPTEAELLALRDFWARRRRGIPMWRVTLFAICSAMRLSEITSLKWADLDEDARTIRIRDRKHPRSKKGNDQTIPLLRGPVSIEGETVDPMQLMEAQRHERDPRIFPYDAGTISTSFTRAVASCGIEDLRFHDLRHDGCSRLFEDGYEIQQVALVSGHKDWNMLRRYAQLDPTSLHREEATP